MIPMKRVFIVILALLASLAFAEQQVSVSGIIKAEDDLPERTRVGVHVVDLDGNTLTEMSSEAIIGGTFSVAAEGPLEEHLQPFRSGAIPLPGLQTEYSVSPDGASYARALTKVYVDENASGRFDGLEHDTGFLGIASLENPVGFFVILYVDQPVTLSGRGAELQLAEGWNIFAVRFPEGGEPDYAVVRNVDDAVLDVFMP